MLFPIVAGIATAGLGSYLYFSGNDHTPEKLAKPPLPDHPLKAAGAVLSSPGDTVKLNGTTFTVIPSPPGPSLTVGGPLIAQGLTPGGNAVLGLHNLNDLGSDFATSATQLSDYLHANGLDRSPTLAGLVNVFQQNAKKKKVGYADAMTQPGVYDLATSAALTVAIGQPFPPDTQGNAFASYPFSVTSDPNGSNAASASATNLWMYLRAHNNDHSPMLQALTKQFQHDVNSDPRFPGPAALGAAKQVQRIKTKLKEDGDWGPSTSAALKVYGMTV